MERLSYSRGYGHAGRPADLAWTHRAEPEAQHEETHAAYDREQPNDPDDCERPCPGEGDENEPEEHGYNSCERQEPLSCQLRTQANGGSDLEDAGEDRPGSDHVHQCKRGETREREGN